MPTSQQNHVDAEGPAARRLVSSDMDVVCLVKRFASDEAVCQRPLLALPEAFLQRLPSNLPERDRPLNPLPLARRRGWVDLARLVLATRSFEDKQGAVNYLLKAAAGGSAAQSAKCPLPWHAEDHSQEIVRLEDARLSPSYRCLFPLVRFRATLKRQ